MIPGLNQSLDILLTPLLDAKQPIDAEALRLYVLLVATANNRGLVVRSRARLAQRLGIAEAAIDRALSALVQASLVRILSPSPYLAIALRFWPSKQAQAEISKNAAAAGSSTAEAAASVDKQAASKQGDEGLGEGGSLATELRMVLGEEDAAALEPILVDVPGSVVRQALARVKATPAHQIKKSRTALFRFLLKTLTTNAP